MFTIVTKNTTLVYYIGEASLYVEMLERTGSGISVPPEDHVEHFTPRIDHDLDHAEHFTPRIDDDLDHLEHLTPWMYHDLDNLQHFTPRIYHDLDHVEHFTPGYITI